MAAPIVPDAPKESEPNVTPETEIPQTPVPSAKVLRDPFKTLRIFRAVGLAFAFAGIAFLVSEHRAAQQAMHSLTPQQSAALSSFIREASLSASRPPALFAYVDESWELLSAERRLQEAEALFDAAETRWGVRDGFIHRGKAVVAERWNGKVVVFGSLHGDEK